MEAFGYSDWKKHSGDGHNPAPDKDVDLIWGIGLVSGQPSRKVNWSFKWDWRLHGPQTGGDPDAQ